MGQQHGGTFYKWNNNMGAALSLSLLLYRQLNLYRTIESGTYNYLQLLTITYNYLQLLTISCNDTIKLYTTCIYLLTQNDITGRRSTYVQ